MIDPAGIEPVDHQLGRRAFMAVFAGGFLSAPQFANAQRGERIARVGILYFGPSLSLEEQERRATWGPFWPTMKELGWVYGKNIVAERRYGETLEQLHAAAAELARLKVDVVLVRNAGLAKIAREEIPSTPIVVGEAGADLVAAGVAASLVRPGGNVTGIQVLGDELIAKRLEFLKMLVPNLSKVAWLRDDVTWAAVPEVGTRYAELAAAAARAQGVALRSLVVHNPAELPAAFLEIRSIETRPSWSSIPHSCGRTVRRPLTLRSSTGSPRSTTLSNLSLTVASYPMG